MYIGLASTIVLRREQEYRVPWQRYVCVYIYVYIYIYIHVYIYTYIYILILVFIKYLCILYIIRWIYMSTYICLY
jgi:hypothetical protein